MAYKRNLIIDADTDYTQTFFAGTNNSGAIVITDTVSTSPVDLTGYSGLSEFRKHFTSNTSVAITVGFGTRTNGEFNLTLDRSLSSSNNVSSGRYLYDVEMTDSANTRYRFMEGEITITPEITKLGD